MRRFGRGGWGHEARADRRPFFAPQVRQLSTSAARPVSKLVKVRGAGGEPPGLRGGRSPARAAGLASSRWLRAALSARPLSRPQPPIQVYGLEGRYATALYSAASKQKKLDQIEKELSRVAVKCSLSSRRVVGAVGFACCLL